MPGQVRSTRVPAVALFDIVAILITLSALFSWVNHRFLKLPTTIGLMLIALVMSLLLLAPIPYTDGLEHDVELMLASVDFDETLLHGMLSFLLFAGALHVNLHDLARQKWVIGVLATAGVLGSTFLVGGGAYLLFGWLGLDIPLIYCLLFGSLISPTDPIAVMGILKSAGAPKSLETKIAGESLFNDGVAVVVFLVLLRIAAGGEHVSPLGILELFLHEAVGGLVFGLSAGWVAFQMLRRVDNYQVEVLITLALAGGGYALAEHLHLSAPIAVVVAGLLIGNTGRERAMSDKTIEHLDSFWELVDEFLNAVLFVIIGLEVMVISLAGDYLAAGLLAIPLVLIARVISVGLPIGIMRRFRSFSPGVVTILTWGGLRGGISVAMALSLPEGEPRDLLVTVTYVIVVFSILVQGMTLGPVVRATAVGAQKELSRTRVAGEGEGGETA
jgi:CPA1 family monovalent cation:H+ antiporter